MVVRFHPPVPLDTTSKHKYLTVTNNQQQVGTEMSKNDAHSTIGYILTEDGGRDAIHTAVISAVAGCNLFPATRVSYLGGTASPLRSEEVKHIGIVDPFLKEPVKRGERFWIMLFPRTITSLQHVWTHPDIAPAIEHVVGQTPPPKDHAAEEEERGWKLIAPECVKEFADQKEIPLRVLMPAAVSSYLSKSADINDYICIDYIHKLLTMSGDENIGFWTEIGMSIGDTEDIARTTAKEICANSAGFECSGC